MYHVARADLLQRLRSRKLLAVFALVVYLGYLVNVGGIELVYQRPAGDAFDNYYGEPTAALIGTKAALTGSFFVLLGGFYLVKNAVERDRSTEVDRLVASAPVPARAYLVGKWLSNVGLLAAVLAVLGVATVINHAVHGVGPTNPLALLGPIALLGLPLAAFVGGVALLFESVDRLSGSLGNVAYFVLIVSSFAVFGAADGRLPGAVPPTTKALDLVGILGVYEATLESVHAVVPGYADGPPSFGQIFDTADTGTFRYTGGGWPAWFYAQRAGLVAAGLAVAAAAAAPFDRFARSGGSASPGVVGRLVASLPFVGGDAGSEGTGGEVPQPREVSLTAVTDRDAGGAVRLLLAEVRLVLRGRAWWWYAGAAAIAAGPVLADASAAQVRGLVLPLALVWPLFALSSLGVRPSRHRVTPLVLSSKRPLVQVLCEWGAGVVLTAGLLSGVAVQLVTTGEGGALVGVAAAVLFVPSFALAAGIWSRTSRLFEGGYLALWYAGPLNQFPPIDFAGVTDAALDHGVPPAFAALGAALLAAAVYRRYREAK